MKQPEPHPPTLLLIQIRRLIRRTDFWLGIAALLLLGGLLLAADLLTDLLARADTVRAWIQSFGPMAPLVYIGLYVAQIVLAPVPGQIFSILAGYLFGVFWGTVYSLIGIALGASLAIGLGRLVGRRILGRFFAEGALRRWERHFRVRAPLTWALLFILPVPDVAYYVAGLTSVPIGTLLVAILFGRALGLLIASALGHWTAHLPPHWVAVQWIAVSLLLLGVYRFQRPLRLYSLHIMRRVRRLMRQATVGKRAKNNKEHCSNLQA